MGTATTLDKALDGMLHPDTGASEFDRWLLYKVAERIGLLPDGMTLPENPDLAPRVASNEDRQAQTPEQQIEDNRRAFEAAVAKAVAAVQAEQVASMQVAIKEATDAAVAKAMEDAKAGYVDQAAQDAKAAEAPSGEGES